MSRKQARENTGVATITELAPMEVRAWVPYEVYVRCSTERTQSAVSGLVLPHGENYPHVGKIGAAGYEFDAKTQEY
jgi:hypothetical protein